MSKCAFPKFHSTVHFFDFVLEFGVPALTYGGWWEKAHRFLCRLPYLRTGRKVKDLHKLVVVRVALAEEVRKQLYVVKKEKSSWCWDLEEVNVEGEEEEEGDRAVPVFKLVRRKRTDKEVNLLEADLEADQDGVGGGEDNVGRLHDGYVRVPAGVSNRY